METELPKLDRQETINTTRVLEGFKKNFFEGIEDGLAAEVNEMLV